MDYSKLGARPKVKNHTAGVRSSSSQPEQHGGFFYPARERHSSQHDQHGGILSPGGVRPSLQREQHTLSPAVTVEEEEVEGTPPLSPIADAEEEVTECPPSEIVFPSTFSKSRLLPRSQLAAAVVAARSPVLVKYSCRSLNSFIFNLTTSALAYVTCMHLVSTLYLKQHPHYFLLLNIHFFQPNYPPLRT